jgi:hypothetical protein
MGCANVKNLPFPRSMDAGVDSILCLSWLLVGVIIGDLGICDAGLKLWSIHSGSG